jgi:Domain of unknown function (DUF4337)
MSAHEQMEHAHEAEHVAGSSRKIALLISVLALFLAFSEMLGKSAQTEALALNITASDMWNFYQSKHMREALLETAARLVQLDLPQTTDPAVKAAKEKQIADWQKTAARYRDTDPQKHESRKDLEEKVHEKEEERDTLFAQYHHYEMASAALQIGIVLASASVITSMTVLAWFGFGIGIVGVALMAVGYFTPHALHLV